MIYALLPTVTLLIALPLSVYSNLAPTLERQDSTTFRDVCIEIESKISDASGVFYRGESKNNMLYFLTPSKVTRPTSGTYSIGQILVQNFQRARSNQEQQQTLEISYVLKLCLCFHPISRIGCIHKLKILGRTRTPFGVGLQFSGSDLYSVPQ